MSGIISWGSYVPAYRITAEEIASVWGGDAKRIKAGLQISQKAVPDVDEDAATIAVEAGRNALHAYPEAKPHIGGIYIGSESHPYAVKPTGSIVGAALGIGNDYTTADFEFACKAGTAAIQAALALVKSGMARYAIAGAADTAQSRPGDPLEYTAGAGGAVFLLGNDNVVCTIDHTLSFTSDTPDFWRRQHERYPSHGGPFTGEPAYFRHISSATKNLLAKTGTKPEDYDHVIFHQPNGKFPTRVAKRLGFSSSQLKAGLLVPEIGNTYSGATMISLANVLDHARPGERILLTSYGSGAGSDAFAMTVTDNILDRQKKTIPLSRYLKDTISISYPAYLQQTNAIRGD